MCHEFDKFYKENNFVESPNYENNKCNPQTTHESAHQIQDFAGKKIVNSEYCRIFLFF